MAEDKKQKVILGVVAALVIGMGGYWFVLRDSGAGASNVAVGSGGGKTKRARAKPKTTKKTRSRRADQGPADRAEKKIREKKERPSKKKSRRGNRGGKVKKRKKTLPPAAYLPPKDDWLEDFDPNSFHPRLT
ncbi:MAG: hypothetical protein IH987_19195 [Planctomycetes bacterium]|nr:hypothetical protein [Planctomycetota bacterium]